MIVIYWNAGSLLRREFTNLDKAKIFAEKVDAIGIYDEENNTVYLTTDKQLLDFESIGIIPENIVTY